MTLVEMVRRYKGTESEHLDITPFIRRYQKWGPDVAKVLTRMNVKSEWSELRHFVCESSLRLTVNEHRKIVMVYTMFHQYRDLAEQFFDEFETSIRRLKGE